MPGGVATCYLRAHFQWTNDPASVILVASNYLSDGAAFYLNGAEVKRVRLPTGDLLFNTPATGGPPAKGEPEIAGLATAPLVIGIGAVIRDPLPRRPGCPRAVQPKACSPRTTQPARRSTTAIR